MKNHSFIFIYATTACIGSAMVGCTLDSAVTADVVVEGSRGDVFSMADSGMAVDVLLPVDIGVDSADASRCRRNSDCDDSIICTIDECDFNTGACMNRPNLERCECDADCHVDTRGVGGMPFDDSGRRGVEFDMAANGLLVRDNRRRPDYLWIPSTIDGTLSKWSAETEREEGRYLVGLSAADCAPAAVGLCNGLSRVVVDGAGNAYGASRAFGRQGTITKVFEARESCIDRNMNGVIETSTGPMDVLPNGTDECVAWIRPVGPVNAVLRSLSIDRGDALNPDGYVWVGGCAAT